MFVRHAGVGIRRPRLVGGTGRVCQCGNCNTLGRSTYYEKSRAAFTPTYHVC